MAPKRQASISLLSLLTLSSFLTLSLATTTTRTGKIAVYWGQNTDEGTLTAACDNENYDIVLLAFIVTFGSFRDLEWNFGGHCGNWNPPTSSCTKLEPEIKYCQRIGKKVFLSLGGDTRNYGLVSSKDATDVATKLYNSFLSGQHGPLGAVTLDGIDFAIDSGSDKYYDDLARELDTLRRQNSYFNLSAAPQCVDLHLEEAIKTHLFDSVWVQFYNNGQCQYSADKGTSLLLSSWNYWTSLLLSNNSLFMGLPATSEAAPSGGYIPSPVLISEVLPVVKETANYGGVMLWSRYWDDLANPIPYSEQIGGYVLKLNAAAKAMFDSLSVKFYRLLPPYLRM